MSRSTARGLHLALILLGLLLYVVFVLPRWWVLTGDIPVGVATVGRLAAGIPIALAALPVFTILRDSLARKAKAPEIALRLRAWAAVLHLIAGGLIVLTAVVEIWLRLAVGGPYLFAVYGAAASIAMLAVLAVYLSFVAEKPPAEPKPPKVKKVKAEKAKAEKKPRGKKKRGAASDETAEETAETAEVDVEAAETEVDVEAAETEVDVEAAETEVDVETAETEVDVETAGSIDTDGEAVETVVVETEGTVDDKSVSTETVAVEALDESAESAATGLRNKRPAGKKRRLLGR